MINLRKEIYNLTIIGGDSVGLYTAFYAGLRGMKIKIIESLPELGGHPAVLYPENNNTFIIITNKKHHMSRAIIIACGNNSLLSRTLGVK